MAIVLDHMSTISSLAGNCVRACQYQRHVNMGHLGEFLWIHSRRAKLQHVFLINLQVQPSDMNVLVTQLCKKVLIWPLTFKIQSPDLTLAPRLIDM